MPSRTAVAVLLALACAFSALRAPALADCQLHQGDRVVLYSTEDDPDVLAWDSPFRLRDYHAATFDEARLLLVHASLLSPGTRASVLGCIADFVHARFEEHPDDAIEILVVTNGHGHVWWVLSSDLRRMQNGTPHKASRAKTAMRPFGKRTRSIATR